MGRLAFRAGWFWPDIEFVHVNEIGGDGTTSVHLLYFDSLHGRWNREVRGEAFGSESARAALFAAGAELFWRVARASA